MNQGASDMTKYLVGKLFEPEDRQHLKVIDLLIQQNNQILRNASPGFTYLGLRYGLEGQYIRNPKDAPALDKELVRTLTKHLSYMGRVQLDRNLINQSLLTLLTPCENTQDMRDALPDCLVALHPALTTLSRTNKPAWTLTGNPRALRQYEGVLPKIEMYCATRFIY